MLLPDSGEATPAVTTSSRESDCLKQKLNSFLYITKYRRSPSLITCPRCGDLSSPFAALASTSSVGPSAAIAPSTCSPRADVGAGANDKMRFAGGPLPAGVSAPCVLWEPWGGDKGAVAGVPSASVRWKGRGRCDAGGRSGEGAVLMDRLAGPTRTGLRCFCEERRKHQGLVRRRRHYMTVLTRSRTLCTKSKRTERLSFQGYAEQLS